MKNTKKGFTLVELLVVIAIIGLLSTIAIVSLGSARAKARDATRIANMKQFATALEQYYADKGEYPEALAATGTALGGATATELSSTGLGTTAVAPVYMALIPAYPTPNANSIITASACAGSYATPTATIANFCYFTPTIVAGDTQSDFKIVYTLDAVNSTLGGDQCTVTSAGTTCS
jgi:prepilin-type N-terminal cleavage/methylation domain-containing protein